MCLLLAAFHAHPVYKLVIAANRDEFYDRPTAAAGFWDEMPDILGGKDLRAGGTWFGITRKGRVAAITNYRDPTTHKPDAPSRGSLVTDFLKGEEEPEVYLSRLTLSGGGYNGFNLVAGVVDRLFWYSNRGDGMQCIMPGIHGLSNHLLDTPWPKVSRGKDALGDILSKMSVLSPERFFDMLMDRFVPADDCLPDTGVSMEWERILSPIFISSSDYGTRSSTLLFVDRENHVTFMERTYGPTPEQNRDAAFEFMLEG